MIIIKRVKEETLTVEQALALKTLGYEIECNDGKVTEIHKKEA